MARFAAILFLVGCFSSPTFAFVQSEEPESMEELRLPPLLVGRDGSTIDSVSDWEQRRRPEVLKLVCDHVYGRVPENVPSMEAREVNRWKMEGGEVDAREIALTFGSGEDSVKATLLVCLPIAQPPAACFIGLNFNGNHTVAADPRISIPTSWVRNRKDLGTTGHRARAENRGDSASRWPIEMITERGYALATMYYGDIDPDFDDHFKNGIHGLVYSPSEGPGPKDWGSIATWAWSLSQAADVLATLPEIDPERLAVIGHSRLGKTALWAGATDPRFKIVISNNSGCGGAALSRRRFGETVARINKVFPHWFCDQFCEYDDNEDEMPVDQHFLASLMAPRAIYVASATEDQWADPTGEYQSLVAASPVFELYGNEPVPTVSPMPDAPQHLGRVGYHLRTGKHDVTRYDWQQYLDFADQQFGK